MQELHALWPKLVSCPCCTFYHFLFPRNYWGWKFESGDHNFHWLLPRRGENGKTETLGEIHTWMKMKEQVREDREVGSKLGHWYDRRQGKIKDS